MMRINVDFSIQFIYKAAVENTFNLKELQKRSFKSNHTYIPVDPIY